MAIASNTMNKRLSFRTVADGETFTIPNSFWFSVTPDTGATITLTNGLPIPLNSDTSVTFATPFSASVDGNAMAEIQVTATGGNVICAWVQG